jgi:dipeptidyl aminopeptidase/acylaminoacyl peptidase
MLLRLLLLAPLVAFAQAGLVAEWQKQYDAWYWPAQMSRPENARWSESGRLLTFAWRDRSGVAWKWVDCSTGLVRPAFDHEKIATALADLTKEKVTPRKWPFDRVVALDDGRVRLESDKAAWVVGADQSLLPVAVGRKVEAAVAEKTGRAPGESKRLSFSKVRAESPSGSHRVELRGGNVILVEVRSAKAVPLTSDGIEGKDGWVGPVSWAPDGRHFALWKERTVAVRRYTVVDSLKQTKREIDYDKPGDDRTERTPWVFSVEGKEGFAPSRDVLPLSYSTERLDWSSDSRRLLSEFIIRGFTGHGLIEFDVIRRGWRRLLTEEDPKFVYSFATRYRYDLGEDRALWLSERTGWLHLYAVDLREGRTLGAVTAGRWVMKEVLKVDEKAGAVTFLALGRDAAENPYHQHICRVGLDGRGLVDLTPGDGNHEATFSPDRRTLIDASSRVDQPPYFTLRSAVDGHAIANLGGGDLTPLTKAGWAPTRAFVAKDREGKFDIWGVVTRPHPFDPNKKYPVIENIYAGPHGSFAPRSFNWWNRNHRELSLSGFYVVQMDGRGTNNRGKEFHQFSWRNLQDGGFADRIAWMKALAKVEPNMDLSRVGIFGGSAGGQNTAHAMLLHGGFYKAGAADCGCYDNRVDKLWWNEQWLGYPVGPWYAENACARLAADLGGRMFLSVGESDTNVDVRCSYDFRDALLAAGKGGQIEFHVVPGANHGAGESSEMREKRARFFLTALGAPAIISR